MSINTELFGHVALITIDRPEALNALNTQVLSELEQALFAITDNKDIRVLIITGAGKAFVAGADISEMSEMNVEEAYKFANIGNRVFTYIESMDIPVIAAVNGYALGGGCELALSCDMRFASEKAKFGQPEVGLGITPGFGGTQRLPRAVGSANAMEMILSGNSIDAKKAKELRLVNEVYAPEALMENVMALAEKIAFNAPVAVRHAKAAIQRFHTLDIVTDLDYEATRFSECFDTDDQKDGMKAFIEKRPHSKYKGE